MDSDPDQARPDVPRRSAKQSAHGDRLDPEPIVEAIRRLQRHGDDDQSFQLLFETYYPEVERFLARRLPSNDGRDLAQETFFRAHRGIDTFRGDAPFGAWLFCIARNVLRRQQSRKSVAQIERHSISIDDDEHPLDRLAEENRGVREDSLAVVLADERRRLLRHAVRRLPDQRRRCVVLWAYQGLTFQQIATVLQLKIGTVKAHMAQARQQLIHLVREQSPDFGVES